jgi:hypothetical protein
MKMAKENGIIFEKKSAWYQSIWRLRWRNINGQSRRSKQWRYVMACENGEMSVMVAAAGVKYPESRKLSAASIIADNTMAAEEGVPASRRRWHGEEKRNSGEENRRRRNSYLAW